MRKNVVMSAMYASLAMFAVLLQATSAARSEEPSRVSQPPIKGMRVIDNEENDLLRKITVISPGVYEAVITSATGGGIPEFYDLTREDQAKTNLTQPSRGLLEIGWHGSETSSDGKSMASIADWPSAYRMRLNLPAVMEVIEQGPARVRVRVKTPLTFWDKRVHEKTSVTCVYTFYPAGRIVSQVSIEYNEETTFNWSREYGPHLYLYHDRKTPASQPFDIRTPKIESLVDEPDAPAEQLVMAYPTTPEIQTSFFITIPIEAQKRFSHSMRHSAHALNWVRGGYGSANVKMTKGFTDEWACMIQMGTKGSPLLKEFKSPRDAVPFADDYREPAKLSDAELVKDDEGDFNKDGFNESQGCHVIKASGPAVSIGYEKGEAAGFAPAFKIVGWKGAVPANVNVDGKNMPAAISLTNGNLIVSIIGEITGKKATIKIGQ